MSPSHPQCRSNFRLTIFDFRLGCNANQKPPIENQKFKCLAWELNPVRRIKSPLCQPLHPQGNLFCDQKSGDSARIRTPCGGFGGHLLSQEHTAVLEIPMVGNPKIQAPMSKE